MTHYLAIGATASASTACYALEDWAELLAAMERGDAEAIERITTVARPHYVATAKLQTVEPPSLKDAAAAFWSRRGKAPKAYASDKNGTPIVLQVARP